MIRVRTADDDDVPALIALRRAWNDENAGARLNDENFDATFTAWWQAERSSRTFFLVELDGDPVGMGNIKRYDRMPVVGRPSGGWWGYVGNMFVLPEHRNAGVGRVLMDEMVSWAWDNGMEHLRLANSPEAQTFYSRLGFVPGSVIELNPPAG